MEQSSGFGNEANASFDINPQTAKTSYINEKQLL
jgi:hypothetical protein